MGNADVHMFSHRDPLLSRLHKEEATLSNRPGSTVLMQIGDKETKRMIKKKFDIANARSRDPTKTMTHSYKSKLNNPMTTSKKWKEQKAGLTLNTDTKTSSGLIPRMASTPMLV